MALDGERILDQKDPSSPLNQLPPPPPPPPEEDPPPLPPRPPLALPPDKSGMRKWRESVRKRADAADETARVVERVLKRDDELEESVWSSEEER